MPKLLGKSMAWPGLGGAFPGMMGAGAPGAAWPPYGIGSHASGPWPAYPGAAAPGPAWGLQPGAGPGQSAFAGWPAAPPFSPSPGAGPFGAPGFPPPAAAPPGFVPGSAAAPVFPPLSQSAAPGLVIGPDITAATPASPAISGSNTFNIPGAVVFSGPGGTTAMPGEWPMGAPPAGGAGGFVPPALAAGGIAGPGQPPPAGPFPLGAGSPAGQPPGAWPAGSGIPGLDPSALGGFNEESIPKAIAAVDPYWVQKWQHYEGWPFTAPPFPFVPDQTPDSAAEAAAADFPCAGNLLDPACLQRCLQALAAGWSVQQQLNGQLAASIQQLAGRLQELESKPSYTIEKLEYNFDQLKVEQLDGTLNIGMTAPSESQMQEFGQMSLPPQVNGGAKVYPLPIPQSAAPGIAQQLAANAAKAGAGTGIATTPAGSSAASVPGGAGAAGSQQSPAPPSFGNAPGTGLAPNLVGSQAPGAAPPPAPGQTLAPGAAAPPGFSGPPAAPNAGASGTTGVAPPGAAVPPGVIPGSPGFGAPGAPGAPGGLQPGPGAFTAPALNNFAGQPPTGSAAVPPAGAGQVPPSAALPGFTDVRGAVHHWLSETAHGMLEEAARLHRLELDPSHRQMVIEDVRRQLPDRIRLYLNEELASRSAMQAASGEPLRKEQLQRTVQRTVRDAQTALEQYVIQLARMAPQRRKD